MGGVDDTAADLQPLRFVPVMEAMIAGGIPVGAIAFFSASHVIRPRSSVPRSRRAANEQRYDSSLSLPDRVSAA